MHIDIIRKQVKQISRLDSFDEWMVMCLVLSIFISAVLTVAVMVVIIGILIWQDRLQGIIESIEGSGYLASFIAITMSVSLVNRNYKGAETAFAMSGLFLVTLFIRSIMTRSLFEKVVRLSCIASLPGFFVILAQRLLISGGPDYRASSLFLNANFYATITEIVVLMCVYQLLRPDHPYPISTLFILIANLGGLYLSNCRTAVFALVVSVLVMLFQNRCFRTAGLLAALIGVTMILIYKFPQLLPRIGQTGSDLANRMAIWHTSVKGFLSHPWFGQGAGSYPLAASRFGGPLTFHAHSLYLDPLLNFGIVGVILLAMYFKENLRSIMRLHESPRDRKYLFLMMAVLSSIMIHGLTDITVFSVQVGLLVSLLMTVAGIHENQPFMKEPGQPGDLQPERNRRIPVPGIATSIIILPDANPESASMIAHRVVRSD